MPAWVRISHGWTTDGLTIVGGHRACPLRRLQDLVSQAAQQIEGYSFPLIGETMPRGSVYCLSLIASHLGEKYATWREKLLKANTMNCLAPFDKYALEANRLCVMFAHNFLESQS